jgi:hypothetical protein
LHTLNNDYLKNIDSYYMANYDKRLSKHGGNSLFQNNPHWHDLILFYEYFHGDNGAGLGACHQTGWTGLVASLIHYCADTYG